ncbi:MAG: hypothetical protein ACYDA1_04145 [Vulcanimicrobiaceae bacterium]
MDDWRFRLLLAVIVAITLHVIAAGLFWKPQPPAKERLQSPCMCEYTVRVVRAKPTPSPTPVPTSAPLRIGRPEGRSAAPARLKTLAAPKITAPKAIASPALSGPPVQSAGAGLAQAGSPGNGTSGTGSGTSGSGNGSGGNVPCGYVSFQNIPPDHPSPDGGIDVTILMTVHFPDGRAASTQLDYPFHYPDETSNPFSAMNAHRATAMTLQRPPIDRANSEPALVAYVLSHTNAAGYTLLQPCPSATP